MSLQLPRKARAEPDQLVSTANKPCCLVCYKKFTPNGTTNNDDWEEFMVTIFFKLLIIGDENAGIISLPLCPQCHSQVSVMASLYKKIRFIQQELCSIRNNVAFTVLETISQNCLNGKGRMNYIRQQICQRWHKPYRAYMETKAKGRDGMELGSAIVKQESSSNASTSHVQKKILVNPDDLALANKSLKNSKAPSSHTIPGRTSSAETNLANSVRKRCPPSSISAMAKYIPMAELQAEAQSNRNVQLDAGIKRNLGNGTVLLQNIRVKANACSGKELTRREPPEINGQRDNGKTTEKKARKDISDESFQVASIDTTKPLILKRNNFPMARAERHRCKHCPRQYSSADGLLKHESYCHTTSKAIQCHLCLKIFSSDNSVRRHIQNIHHATDEDDIGEIANEKSKEIITSYQQTSLCSSDEEGESSESKCEESKEVIKLLGVQLLSSDIGRLNNGVYLNDKIIEFWLNYIQLNLLSHEDTKRTYIFSSFFYTTLTNQSRGESMEIPFAERHHSRVANWTKKEDIFSYDFLLVPIVQNAHWFLAVICFPSLDGIYDMDTGEFVSKLKSKKDKDDQSLSGGGSQLPNIKQPCILIFDSIAKDMHEEIHENLREYLTVEHKVKKGVEKEFSYQSMPGSTPCVPRQPNLCDCGLYLLQYAESFFSNPIKSFRTPFNLQLKTWFENSVAQNKRQNIYNSIVELVKKVSPEDVAYIPQLIFEEEEEEEHQQEEEHLQEAEEQQEEEEHLQEEEEEHLQEEQEEEEDHLQEEEEDHMQEEVHEEEEEDLHEEEEEHLHEEHLQEEEEQEEEHLQEEEEQEEEHLQEEEEQEEEHLQEEENQEEEHLHEEEEQEEEHLYEEEEQEEEHLYEEEEQEEEHLYEEEEQEEEHLQEEEEEEPTESCEKDVSEIQKSLQQMEDVVFGSSTNCAKNVEGPIIVSTFTLTHARAPMPNIEADGFDHEMAKVEIPRVVKSLLSKPSSTVLRAVTSGILPLELFSGPSADPSEEFLTVPKSSIKSTTISSSANCATAIENPSPEKKLPCYLSPNAKDLAEYKRGFYDGVRFCESFLPRSKQRCPFTRVRNFKVPVNLISTVEVEISPDAAIRMGVANTSGNMVSQPVCQTHNIKDSWEINEIKSPGEREDKVKQESNTPTGTQSSHLSPQLVHFVHRMINGVKNDVTSLKSVRKEHDQISLSPAKRPKLDTDEH